MKTINLNATTARNNFFSLLDKIAKDDISVIVSKKDTGEEVIIKKRNVQDKNFLEDANKRVERLFGSINTPYNPKEKEVAHKNKTKKYKIKYNK